jgi:hypothetical protein
VRVAGLRSYLERRGWRLQSYPGPELLVFAGPVDDDGLPITQVLPSSEQMRDYPLRVEELIGALSVLEDRPASDVLTDVLNESAVEQSAPAPTVNGAGAPAPSAEPRP